MHCTLPLKPLSSLSSSLARSLVTPPQPIWSSRSSFWKGRAGAGVRGTAEALERRHGELHGHVRHAEHLLDQHRHDQRVRARTRGQRQRIGRRRTRASADMVDIHIASIFKVLHSEQNYLRIQDDTLRGHSPQLMLPPRITWRNLSMLERCC